jgi:hypothetical protein
LRIFSEFPKHETNLVATTGHATFDEGVGRRVHVARIAADERKARQT